MVLTKCFCSRFSSRTLYSFFFVYLYVNGSGSITSVGEERANLSIIMWFLFGEATLFYCGTP